MRPMSLAFLLHRAPHMTIWLNIAGDAEPAVVIACVTEAAAGASIAAAEAAAAASVAAAASPAGSKGYCSLGGKLRVYD